MSGLLFVALVGSNILGGVTTIAGHAWAGGVYDDGGSEMPLNPLGVLA
ncbi:MAG TPA: hypothetical protein VIY52_28865 [Streptosporangiaceae bacterium]